MSVVAAPALQPRKIELAKLVLAFLLLLGLMSFAAAGQVARNQVECQDVILTADDGVMALTSNGAVLTGGRECQVTGGPVPR